MGGAFLQRGRVEVRCARDEFRFQIRRLVHHGVGELLDGAHHDLRMRRRDRPRCLCGRNERELRRQTRLTGQRLAWSGRVRRSNTRVRVRRRHVQQLPHERSRVRRAMRVRQAELFGLDDAAVLQGGELVADGLDRLPVGEQLSLGAGARGIVHERGGDETEIGERHRSEVFTSHHAHTFDYSRNGWS